MATTGTPDLESYNGLMYLIPVPMLSTIALALCVLRLWTRVTRTRSMYIDDWLIAIAMVCRYYRFQVPRTTSDSPRCYRSSTWVLHLARSHTVGVISISLLHQRILSRSSSCCLGYRPPG